MDGSAGFTVPLGLLNLRHQFKWSDNQMKRLTYSICILFLMAGCASYPATRDGYISAVQEGGALAKKLADIKDAKINLPINKVFLNLKTQFEKCVIPQYSSKSQINVSFVSTTTVFNDIQAVMISPEKAEISFQQSTTSGVEKHYELVIDLIKISDTQTHYKSYANKRYAEAPFMWAKGSLDCLGFDGYIIDAHRP